MEDRRTREILSRMTLWEKMRMLAGRGGLHSATPWTYALGLYKSPGCPSLGVPGIRFTDGPRGLNLGRATAFPAPICRGAAWDKDLERRVGRAMGLEAAAAGANTMGSACVNLIRHPAWGRAQECFGADSFHTGVLGAAHVAGLAENVMPVVKHFACYNVENQRFSVNVEADERALREVFLPHFRACVDAGAAGVMTTYNRLNGEWTGENRHLITDILKGEWGFDGFVVPDFLLGLHHTARALNAGMDLEMPQAFFFSLPALAAALARGRVSRDRIEDAAQRLVRMQVRFGLVGRQKPRPDRGVTACPDHRALALETAEKGMVLLKNLGRALPFSRSGLQSLAVIGEPAFTPQLGSPGSAVVRPPEAITPLAGILELAGNVNIRACRGTGRQMGRAVEMAAASDAAVVFAGIRPREEGEYFPLLGGGDRRTLEISPDQEDLIRRVAAACPRCVVVLTGGSAVAAGAWIEAPAAVVMAWYGGMEAGRAVARVLFGDAAPGGRLPLSFPRTTAQLFPFDPDARQLTYSLFHDYRYLDQMGQTPLFPLGHGLSYTSFSLSNLALASETILPDGFLTLSATVKNTGDRAGEEVVQAYVSHPESRVTRPVRELKGFARLALSPGEEGEARIRIPARDLAHWDPERGAWTVEPVGYRVAVGTSAGNLPLSAGFRVRK